LNGTHSDSEISTPPDGSSETSTSKSSSSSPVKNASTKFPSKDLPPPTIEQTPTRFLAACSKHDLEPNPFEQSFSGVNPLSESTGANSPKPSLPSVAELASPSPGIHGNEDQYGWNLQSLRSGPLSPSMLAGPQETIIFDDLRTTGRTGTTPLPYGSFSNPSPRTAALFGAAATNTSLASSFMNVMTLSNSANATDPFGRNMFAQKPLTESERKTINTESVTSVSGISTSQPGVIQSGVSATNLLGINNGSNTVAPAANVMVTNPLGQTLMVAGTTLNRNMMTSSQQDAINRNVSIISDAIMPKPEKDDFTESANNTIVVLNNGSQHTNGISSNIPQHKGSILTGQPMEQDDRSTSSSPIKGIARSARRKAEDSLISEQSPSKKNGQKSKSDMTDEEKRRNFLERNRQGN